MSLNAEPPSPSGRSPEPTPADARASTSSSTASAETPTGAATVAPVTGRVWQPDSGSMRPLTVFLVAAAIALVGTIVFALVHVTNERAQEELASARTQVVHAVDEGHTAQESLTDRIAAAEKALAASKGKVAEPEVRDDLAGHVAAAKELDQLQPPTVPEQGEDGFDSPEDAEALRAKATEWSMTMRTTSTTLESATEDVRASYATWQKARQDAKAKAKADAARAQQSKQRLATAKTTLSKVSAQLKISVRDSAYTLDWTAGLGAPQDARTTLSDHRAEGQAALAAAARPQKLDSVQALGKRREAARTAIEAAAWDLRATVADGSNGRLEQGDLCRVGIGPEGQVQYLRCDAAAAWKKVGAAFQKKFGKHLRVEYGYRPYDWQLQALDEFGSGQVAAPGTSNHGWAAAVDVPVDDGFRFGHPEYEWLAANGPEFGWIHPEWARAGGGREEPWHFEYTG